MVLVSFSYLPPPPIHFVHGADLTLFMSHSTHYKQFASNWPSKLEIMNKCDQVIGFPFFVYSTCCTLILCTVIPFGYFNWPFRLFPFIGIIAFGHTSLNLAFFKLYEMTTFVRAMAHLKTFVELHPLSCCFVHC